MRILNGTVFVDGSFVQADVEIEGNLVVAVGQGEHVAALGDVDASGCYVVPGFIDLHFHGCAGHDFCDATPHAIASIARWQASQGVTAMCPATMTLPESELAVVMDTAAAFTPETDEAALVGINMEGPFISPHKVGAQNPAYVQPCDLSLFQRLQQRSAGLIKLVDVAPEEEGALDFIRAVSDDVRVSLAHTCADYDAAIRAFEAGARQLTHVCNAMPPLLHRDPGPIGAALDAGDVTAELIADGIHVHPSMVRALFSLFGPERIILISDSMEATGLDDGDYALGGQSVHVEGKRAQLADGTIAGSVTSLPDCVRTAVFDMGIALEDALRAATINPARALGLEGERGSIEAGKNADIVILDEHLNLVNVVLRGVLQR